MSKLGEVRVFAGVSGANAWTDLLTAAANTNGAILRTAVLLRTDLAAEDLSVISFLAIYDGATYAVIASGPGLNASPPISDLIVPPGASIVVRSTHAIGGAAITYDLL